MESEDLYIDSHNHLLDYEQENEVHQILDEARAVGVRLCVPNTTRQQQYLPLIKLSQKYPFKLMENYNDAPMQIIPSFGVHPCFVQYELDNKDWKINLQKLINQNQYYGIGEIGLDYRKDTFEKNTKQKQMYYFTEQLQMSFRMNRSVTVHCVRAHGEMLKIFKKYNKLFEEYSKHEEKHIKIDLKQGEQLIASQYKRNPIIMHSYGGSKQITTSLLKLKHLNIFFSLCLKRSEQLCEVIPIEQLVLETDAPYQNDIKVLQEEKIVPEELSEENIKLLEKKNRVSYVRANTGLAQYYKMDKHQFTSIIFKNSLRAFKLLK